MERVLTALPTALALAMAALLIKTATRHLLAAFFLAQVLSASVRIQVLLQEISF